MGSAEVLVVDAQWLADARVVLAIPTCTGLLSLQDSGVWAVWTDGEKPALTNGSDSDLWHGSGHNGVVRIARQQSSYTVGFWYESFDKVHGSRWRHVSESIIEVDSADQLLAAAGTSRATALLVMGTPTSATIYSVARGGEVVSQSLDLVLGQQPDLISEWSGQRVVVTGATLNTAR